MNSVVLPFLLGLAGDWNAVTGAHISPVAVSYEQ